MISIPFDPDHLTGIEKTIFERWLKIAERAQAVHNSEVAAGRQPSFRNDIWSSLKRFLLDYVFHGKCAYCEVNVEAGFVGDAEHYRPKGAVLGCAHPGYFWMAYDWRNLLPSCQKCNAGEGKGTQFPIEGTRANSPADAATFESLNALERPLLLHPYDLSRDPANHIVFTPDGAIVGIDLIGDTTIRVLNLDRAGLQNLRRLVIRYAMDTFIIELGLALRESFHTWPQRVDEIHARMAAPDAIFAAAIRDAVAVVRSALAPR